MHTLYFMSMEFCKRVRYLHNVQCKCTNCTMVYKATFLEWRNSTDFQKLTRPFPFAKDGGHSSHTLFDDTLILCILLTSYMIIRSTTFLEWRNSTDFQKLARPFPFAKDEGHSLHILLDDTLILCILLTLYMIIQYSTTQLMMNRSKKFGFNFFLIFFNQTLNLWWRVRHNNIQTPKSRSMKQNCQLKPSSLIH